MKKIHYDDLLQLVPTKVTTIDYAALLAVFPALRLLAETPQDPHYHAEGDVWTHTQMVVRALVEGADYQQACATERFVMFYAALLHDIAKPGTTVIDPQSGRIGQPGHSRRGAIDARILLWYLQVPFELREQICRIISVHQVPFFAIKGSRDGQSSEYLIHKLSHELDLHLLSAVAEADMRGRQYQHQQDCLIDIALFREYAKELQCYRQAKVFADAHTRISYFRGAEISPDYPFHQNPGSRVIVMAGLPASGKNTWVSQHHANLPVVSFDDARAELGLRHGQNEGAVAHFALDQAKDLLRQRQDFVWNATQLTTLMRKKTLDLLYAYQAEVSMVYLETTPEQLFQRNHQRDTSLRNAALEKMLLRWELPLPTETHQIEYLLT